MKLINRKNFFSIVCISFTLVVIGKLTLEAIMGFTDKNYTMNIFAILGFSVIITSVLALHFYLQRFPLLPVLIGQYLAVVGCAVMLVKITDIVAGTDTNAMWQMILSVTIPFVFSAIVYYIVFFSQVKKANNILTEITKNEK